MAVPLVTPLRFIALSPSELSLAAVLKSGQAFRWTQRKISVHHATALANDDDVKPHKKSVVEWSMGWNDRTIVLRQDGLGLYYQSWFDPNRSDAYSLDCRSDTTKSFLQYYLNLSTRLCDLYDDWGLRDSNFVKKTESGKFSGLRVCRQDAWEALIAFICSSNNNIPRITLMLTKLCAEFGDVVPTPEPGTTLDSSSSIFGMSESATIPAYYTFPSAQVLAGPDVSIKLRTLGFGYRAEYVAKTARRICEIAHEASHTGIWPIVIPSNNVSDVDVDLQKLAIVKVETNDSNLDPLDFLHHLSTLPYTIAHTTLVTHFAGVGPKVGDCICLFGLGFNSVVPVDVHVYQIAVRDYGLRKVGGRSGPVSKLVYKQVQQHLEDLWGPWAGWAQQVLFTADLKSFLDWKDPAIEVDEERIAPFVKKEDLADVDDAFAPSVPSSHVESKTRIKRRGNSPSPAAEHFKRKCKIEAEETESIHRTETIIAEARALNYLPTPPVTPAKELSLDQVLTGHIRRSTRRRNQR